VQVEPSKTRPAPKVAVTRARKGCTCEGCVASPCGECSPCLNKALHKRCKGRKCLQVKKASPKAVQQGVRKMKSPMPSGSMTKGTKRRKKSSPPPSAANSPSLKTRLRRRGSKKFTNTTTS